jgi:hypothetical protein
MVVYVQYCSSLYAAKGGQTVGGTAVNSIDRPCPLVTRRPRKACLFVDVWPLYTQYSFRTNVFSTIPHSSQVARLKVPFDSLWFVKSPAQVLQVLSDSKTFDFEPMKNMALQRILGLPRRIIKLANLDNSGVGRKPLPTSNVSCDKRFNYLERQATKDFTRPASHAVFIEKFEGNLYKWVEQCTIGQEWVSYPDLYPFIRDILFRATTNAFYGPKLLQSHPHLQDDIWKFDQSVPFLAKGLPCVLGSSARRIRDKCIQALRVWRASFLQETSENLPEWTENSGLKSTTLRKEVFDQFQEWDETSCAASDLAVLFGQVLCDHTII